MPEYDPTDVGRRCVECGASFLSRLPFRRCPACRELPEATVLHVIAAFAMGGILGSAMARSKLRGNSANWVGHAQVQFQ